MAVAVGFCAAHVVLAPLMRNFPAIGIAHAYATFIAGLWVATTSRKLERIAYVTAYICAAEVLWRMSRAGVHWEFAKYAVVSILLVGIVRCRKRRIGLGFAFIALLLPSVLLTIDALDLDLARAWLIGTLGGPVVIGVAAAFFSSIRLDSRAMRTTFVAMLGPIIGIATLALFRTWMADNIVFANDSNRVTSGGFGPNQVSAMLGLGALLLVLFTLAPRTRWYARILTIVGTLVLAMQTALTFARGGLVLALAGAGCAALVLARVSARTRIMVLVLGAVLYSVGAFVVAPELDDFTDGKIAERYASSKSSGRDVLALSELDMFVSSPVLGVGPGLGWYVRNEEGGFNASSHTEYTRMLAEHGLLGLFAMVCLILIAVRAVRGAREPYSRAVASALVAWALLFLAIYSTRLAAPGIALGIACSLWTPRPRAGPTKSPA